MFCNNDETQCTKNYYIEKMKRNAEENEMIHQSICVPLKINQRILKINSNEHITCQNNSKTSEKKS